MHSVGTGYIWNNKASRLVRLDDGYKMTATSVTTEANLLVILNQTAKAAEKWSLLIKCITLISAMAERTDITQDKFVSSY